MRTPKGNLGGCGEHRVSWLVVQHWWVFAEAPWDVFAEALGEHACTPCAVVTQRGVYHTRPFGKVDEVG